MQWKAYLTNDRGDLSYVSTVVYLLVTMICLAFILNLTSLLMTKQQLNRYTDQLTKQIQLAGGETAETVDLFNQIQDQLPTITGLHYDIEARYKTPTPNGMHSAIQLGTPFRVLVSGHAELGGIWSILPVDIVISSNGVGVSEKYFK